MLNGSRTPPPAGWPSLALLGALAVLSVGLSLLLVTPQIWLDDPYIGYRYAANLVEGKGLVFNPGDPIEGYTAFLWIMFAYLGMLVDIPPLAFLQAISVVAQVATLALVFALGRGHGRAGPWSLLAPALLSVHVAFVTWPMMGMSTSFLAMLVTMAVYLHQRGAMESTRGALGMGCLLLVVCLTRFDGLVLSSILIGYGLFVERRPKQWVPTIALLGLGLLVYNAWRIGYYGDLLPNTFHAKQSDTMKQLKGGLHYVWRFAFHGGPYLLVVALFPVVVRRASRTLRLAAWIAGFQVLYVIAVGGDWMVYYRFLLPVLPLICLLLQESLWRVHDVAVGAGVLRPGLGRPLLVAVVLALLVSGTLPLVRSRWTKPGAHTAGTYWRADHARIIGEHLDRTLPADALVATEWAGIIPYHMRQPILDIFGLNDGDISAREFPGSTMGRGITPEYLVGRRPDLVIVTALIHPTVEAARAGIDARPPGRIQRFYASLREPEYGYELCVTEIEGYGYWPFLIRPDHPDRGRLCVGE